MYVLTVDQIDSRDTEVDAVAPILAEHIAGPAVEMLISSAPTGHGNLVSAVVTPTGGGFTQQSA